jgi:hypothetical protein
MNERKRPNLRKKGRQRRRQSTPASKLLKKRIVSLSLFKSI